ncbi:hypothetical protein TraAM80_05747 [Trypanosoma rangeli]|uniref:Ankyrin repeat protein n=1 Tax=Trypanosoma rangeli TaxID=5698 RepID=A0A3R7KL22_TRYRA|nr:uncharacterized protein TraAM80_05747 [Trypanosoma rangeli]RNF03587.1 hypothetical protein TraAM80_05747 [Trypanosoma rangeli]|eukprot:RNF03587.1 hypothetical protein TraAM80_05747 [Trypanosoma rangeli]
MRSRDLCSAAFYDDVQRMKQLIRASLLSEDEEDEETAIYNDEDEEVEEEQLSIHRLERIRKRRAAVASLLGKPGLLRVIETGEEFGFMFRVVEVCENDGGCGLKTQFKLTRRSRYPAMPLHWAVIGRSHRAVEFLVSSGVDVDQEVCDFPKVTAAVICACNESFETARRLEKAVEVQRQRLQNEEEDHRKWVETLEKKKLERERLAALEEAEEEEHKEAGRAGRARGGGNR